MMAGRNGHAPVDGYAAALFEVARAEGVLDTVEDELFVVSRTIAGNGPLRDALSDPAVPDDRRVALVDDLLQRSHRLTRSLVVFVVTAGRVRDLPAIVDDFMGRVAAARRRAVAEVTSAVPLDDALRRRLAEALSHATGKDVEVHVIVDPDVLGGVRARIGDRVIDGTVRTRLRQLHEMLSWPT
jgi:F-type H+-transporting ATPase subunit delta